MDEYILLHCDHDIIASLKKQRDAAKQAYIEFCCKNKLKPDFIDE